jgi:tetratricopeptide (TPR) repeat protein
LSGKGNERPNARSASVPVDLLLASGERRQRTGDLASAEQAYRRALSEYPYEPRATQLLAAILVDRNDLDGAIDLFEAAAPHVGPPQLANFAFYSNFAFTLRRAGRLRSAESVLRALVATAPGAWQPWHNLGLTLNDLERHDEAVVALRRAVMLEPEYGPNHAALGEILHNLGRLNSADVALRRAIELGCADDHGVWTVLARNQRMLGHLDEALQMVERALELSGGSVAALRNAGVLLMELGRFDESVAHLEAAIAADPGNDESHSYLGYALLAAGRLSESFDPWDRAIKAGPRGNERDLQVPRWTPAAADARVLVYREQGVGDEIMLASLYPDLIDAARSVVIECDARLVPLFTRSFPAAEVRAQTRDELFRETVRDVDCATPAGSLIRWFRPTVEAFPDRPSYLVPDAARVAQWRERLAALGPGPYVGISWRSKLRTAERRIEYTRLDEWGDVFSVPGATWVNLQYDDCNRELHDAESRFGVRIHRWDWLDLMNDFDEVAALVRALDLVVAPFNAVSMRSGALGVRTLAMGNRYGWGELGTGRMPWTPSIVVASRMPNEEWDEVLSVAAREVAMLAAPAAPTARRGVARVGGGMSCST